MIKKETYPLIGNMAFILLERLIVRLLLNFSGKLNLLRLSNYITKLSLFGMNEMVQSGSKNFANYLMVVFLFGLAFAY